MSTLQVNSFMTKYINFYYMNGLINCSTMASLCIYFKNYNKNYQIMKNYHESANLRARNYCTNLSF